METAVRLLETFADGGVNVCFANPGTSEMHLVAALDQVPGIRPVLGLFEGVATGAADGYGRMTGAPALTLLHLGPGLSNGAANLHNAFRARTPVINLIGDHASYHRKNDAPLQSDIEGLARPVSRWLATATTPARAVELAAWAVVAATRQGPGSLIIPADIAWSDEEALSPPPSQSSLPPPAWDQRIDEIASRLRSPGCAIIVGGRRLGAEACAAALRISVATGALVLTETFPARVERGRGRAVLPRVPYLIEMSAGLLGSVGTVILAGAPAPVAFFALPGRPTRPTPEAADFLTLVAPGDDPTAALVALAEVVAGPAGEAVSASPVVAPGFGEADGDRALDADLLARAVTATLPDQAIVCDESISLGFYAYDYAASAAPHDWLSLTGGAIGQGLPLATGAAIACPDRRVLALQADGSALYTIQALWTQAREGLDVTNVVLNNGAYAILELELARAGAPAGGHAARSLFDLTRPAIDFTALAAGFGVPATRVHTAGELAAALGRANATPGPHLIEAMFR
jgi:acetolactate synthase-1/2/3 large subunit